MRTQRRLFVSPLFLLTITLLLLHHLTPTLSLIDPTTSSSSSSSPSPVSTPIPTTTPACATKNDTEFVRTACEHTTYPQTCYKSLSRYARAIHQDPARLVRRAIAVSLNKVRHAAKYFSMRSKDANYRASPGVGAAVDACVEMFDDAVNELRNALDQMHHLVGGSDDKSRRKMNDILTFLSSAVTVEGTCTDGFDELVPDGPTKKDAFDRVGKVLEVTGTAIDLFSSFSDNLLAAADSIP